LHHPPAASPDAEHREPTRRAKDLAALVCTCRRFAVDLRTSISRVVRCARRELLFQARPTRRKAAALRWSRSQAAARLTATRLRARSEEVHHLWSGSELSKLPAGCTSWRVGMHGRGCGCQHSRNPPFLRRLHLLWLLEEQAVAVRRALHAADTPGCA
jgi:hypothetical protein